jgi:ribosomal-protein-alanine N-acetyltransferase
MKNSTKLFGEKTLLKKFESNFITKKYVDWLNDPVTVRYSNQRFNQHSIESCKKYLKSFSDTQNIFFAVIRSSDQELIGTMTAYINTQHGTADVGILIGAQSVWGKGFGIDAWNVMLEFLFKEKKIRKVTAGTVRSNIGMIRIMEKSGMQLEATRPKQMVFDSKEEDVLLFGKFSPS